MLHIPRWVLTTAALVLGIFSLSCAEAANNADASDLPCVAPADNNGFYHNTDALTGRCFAFEGVYLHSLANGRHLIDPQDPLVPLYSVEGTPSCIGRVYDPLTRDDWVSFPGTFTSIAAHSHLTLPVTGDGDLINLPEVVCEAPANNYVKEAPTFIFGYMWVDEFGYMWVDENSPAGTEVGGYLLADHPNPDATLTYSLGGPDASLFVQDPTTGVITVGTGTVLDHETQSLYTVTTTASDGTYTDTAEITIRVDAAEVPAEPTVIEREVVKEVPRDVIVEKEVIISPAATISGP